MKILTELLNDKKTKMIIIAVLAVIFVIIMACSMMNSKKEEPAPENTQPEKIEITSEIEEELTKKIKELKSYYYCDIQTTTEKYRNDCMYRNAKTEVGKLSEEYRIYALVLAMNNAMDKKTNYIVGNIIVDNFKFNNTQFIDYSVLEKEYLSLYGENNTFTPSVVNDMNIFPYMKYDETRKKMLYQTTGGTPSENNKNEVVDYINDFESDETNVYVYVSVAYVSPLDSTTYAVYKDKERASLTKKVTSEVWNEGNVITTKDFSNYPEYKFTFTKEEATGNLIFKQVELVS